MCCVLNLQLFLNVYLYASLYLCWSVFQGSHGTTLSAKVEIFFFSCKPFDRFCSEEHMHENIIVNSHAVFCSSLKD